MADKQQERNTSEVTRAGSPYQDDQGQPLLRKSVVAWMDILGFREISERARERSEEENVLAILAGALTRLVAGLRPRLDGLDGFARRAWLVKAFTDNFVVGFPVSPQAPTEGVPELLIVVGRLGRFQLELALEGFFLRGAVTVGPLYIDENLVYGDALFEVYDAETKRARDPRIILTSTAKAVVDREFERWQGGPPISPADPLFWQDADEEVFVNYLYGTTEFEHDMGFPDKEMFVRHGSVVTDKLREHVREPKTRSKYAWAARYHNAFLDLRPDFPEESRIPLAKRRRSGKRAGNFSPYTPYHK